MPPHSGAGIAASEHMEPMASSDVSTHVVGAAQVSSDSQKYVLGVVLKMSLGVGTSPPPDGPPLTEHHCGVTPFKQRHEPSFPPPGHSCEPQLQPARHAVRQAAAATPAVGNLMGLSPASWCKSNAAAGRRPRPRLGARLRRL